MQIMYESTNVYKQSLNKNVYVMRLINGQNIAG